MVIQRFLSIPFSILNYRVYWTIYRVDTTIYRVDTTIYRVDCEIIDKKKGDGAVPQFIAAATFKALHHSSK